MKRYLFSLLLLPLLLNCDSSDGPALGRDGRALGEPPATGTVTLVRDSISLTVDPRFGGRITSLKYGDREVLNTSRDSSGFEFGSTAWTSPQSDWKWPPTAIIDSEPYKLQKVEDHSILMISKESDEGLVLQKRFRLGPDSDIGLTYWLTYQGDSIRSVGIWEVTRLPYAGRVEFYADSVSINNGDRSLLEQQDSFYSVSIEDRQFKSPKIFADLSAVPVTYYNNGLAFEKHTVVTDLRQVAPGQAPLEIYWASDRQFMELELHGQYRELRYGETVVLRTKWRLAHSLHEPPT